MPAGYRILIVEDEAHSARALEIFFADRGFEVRLAASAGEALATAADGFTPDVLLTDVVLMGEGDGFSVVRSLRQASAEIPVVVMSGLPEHEVRERAGGVDRYEFCAKPLRLARVAQVVDEVLENRGT